MFGWEVASTVSYSCNTEAILIHKRDYEWKPHLNSRLWLVPGDVSSDITRWWCNQEIISHSVKLFVSVRMCVCVWERICLFAQFIFQICQIICCHYWKRQTLFLDDSALHAWCSSQGSVLFSRWMMFIVVDLVFLKECRLSEFRTAVRQRSAECLSLDTRLLWRYRWHQGETGELLFTALRLRSVASEF